MPTDMPSFSHLSIYPPAWLSKLPCLVGSALLLIAGCNSPPQTGDGRMDMATPPPPGPDPSTQPELKWALRCGSSRLDATASHEIGTDAAFDNAGNVYITGSFSGSVTCTAVGVMPPTGFSAIGPMGGSFVAKLSPEGIVQWVKSLGSASTSFDTFETRVAVRRDGVLYVSGYSQPSASIEGTVIGGERFLLSLDTDGHLRWVVPVRVPVGSQMKITSLGVTQTGGQYAVQVGGLCRGVSLTAPSDCPDWSQYIWPVLDAGVNQAKLQTVHLFRLGANPDQNLGVFDLGGDDLGRLTWVGGNTVSVEMTGVMPRPTGETTYLVRRQGDGQWSGGFVLENKQVATLTPSLTHNLPWLNDSLRFGTRAYVDHLGNTYVGTLFNKNEPLPWIRKFGPDGNTGLWDETVTAKTTANDYSFGFIGIRGDHDEHPVFAAHAFGINRLQNSGYALVGAAERMSGERPDYDILVWKLDSSQTANGAHPVPLWTVPTRIALGTKSLVGFDVHRPTNRFVVLSRTYAGTVQVDGKDLPTLTGAAAKKDKEHDLVLFVFAPKTGS